MPTFLDISEESSEEIRILIIDDDEVDQMAITRSLLKSRLVSKVFTSTTASEGLKLLQESDFDCIFVDFKLPDMDGLELMGKINELQVKAPVLIVTSHGDERIAAQAIRLGAADYIPKSLLTPEGIFHSIRNALRLQKAKYDRQLAEEQLRSTQDQLELIISNSPMAFWNVNKDGILLFAKGMAFDWLGFNYHEIIGKSVFEVYKRYPRIISRFQKALRGEVIQSVDEIGAYYFKSHYMPVFSSSGKVVGVTGFAIDITERINNERDLTKAKEIAEKSVQVKEQFLANISHEIRTPMNGIIGLTHVLQKTHLGSEQQKYLGAIQKSADNLMDIINDLLDFSKITAQQFTFEEVEFNLPEQITDVIELMNSKASERTNTLEFTIDPSVPNRIIGDPLRLRQVLLNLVGNAIKFTQNGTIKVFAQVLQEREHDLLMEFIVEDTGIGISPEKIHTVFESFNQGSNDTTRKYGGTGLGLTISKNIVEMQGGAISVRSQLMQGSTFTFSLPFKKLQEVKPKEPVVVNTAFIQEVDMSGLHILLAEDNEINQLLIRTVLTNWGVDIDIVNNGVEALDQYMFNQYDLILMDMQMPEMDGYEAIAQIRALNSEKATVPIIALTAHASSDEAERCISAGANAYVAKPFEQIELKQAIYNLTKASTETETTIASVNLQSLEDMADNSSAFMLEVLSMYISSIPDSVCSLVQLVEDNNLESLHVNLVEFYDSVIIIDAQPLVSIIEAMQVALKLHDLPLLQQLSNQIQSEHRQVIVLLEKEFAKTKQTANY
ncbi:response regulator [Pontibacter sp. MBLB2868]|uniref:hybrid sensor histidine kinase/response regulator n=1 Tax=Pontibacter sp. MBLB2868 TaxID=3451555 RepID=UPI003F750CA2